MRFIYAGLLAGIVLGSAREALPMNGIAFSVSNAPGQHLDGGIIGPIVKYTIGDDIVTRCDTIYKEYWAGYPVVNVRGTSVAFERQTLRGGTDTLKSNNRYRYIAVMDINGQNVRDLDTIADGDGGSKRILICWPAGDYIYYHYNTVWSYGSESWASNGNPISRIMKVKYNDPSTRQLVYIYRDIKTFSLSLDGTRAGVTSPQGCAGKSSPFCNLPHAFPPTADPDGGSWSQGLVIGCGSYISPSGKHHWHFWEGGHTVNRIETVSMPDQVLATVETNFNTIADWTGMPRDSVAGGNMDWGRWAANSDKWFCGSGRNKTGATNQVLWNWIDHKAINTSRNSARIGDFTPNSECGALWVSGGPGGDTYEDVNGTWVEVPGGVGIINEWIRPTGAGKTPAGHGAATVFNLKGVRVEVLEPTALVQGVGAQQPCGIHVVVGRGTTGNREVRIISDGSRVRQHRP